MFVLLNHYICFLLLKRKHSNIFIFILFHYFTYHIFYYQLSVLSHPCQSMREMSTVSKLSTMLTNILIIGCVFPLFSWRWYPQVKAALCLSHTGFILSEIWMLLPLSFSLRIQKRSTPWLRDSLWVPYKSWYSHNCQNHWCGLCIWIRK